MTALLGTFLVSFLVHSTAGAQEGEPLDAGETARPAVDPVEERVSSRVIPVVFVTANRRTQDVQDISNSIRVLDGEALERAGATGFADYVFSVPGTDLVDNGLEKRIAIRGISNFSNTGGGGFGGSTSPIGIYLNDTPIQGNGVLPDLDLYDLERIEVLKGPQGTLYGEGAQGGAIKMLTHTADPSGLFAKGEVGVGQTDNGSGLDNFQKLALNVPVYGSWAVRLVGTRREDQGFVDFPNRGTRGEDDATNLMGRVHVDGELWEGLSVSALFMHQRQRLENFPSVYLAEGDLTSIDSEPQFADTDFSLWGFTLDYDLGFATLISSTSGFFNDRSVLRRWPFLQFVIGTDPTVVRPLEREWLEPNNQQRAIAQELRLTSSGDSWLDWIAGFYYRHRNNRFDAVVNNSFVEAMPFPQGPGLIRQLGKETIEQYALFGETQLELPWNLELGLGLRAFRETASMDGQLLQRGPIVDIPLVQFAPFNFEITSTAVTPKVSLSWFPDEGRMLYGQIAKGVRSGGTNSAALVTTVTPLFDPDDLWSYELGAKTECFDGLLTANLAFFHNEWTDLQVGTLQDAQIRGTSITTTNMVTLNAGKAFTRGAELELRALPTNDLALGFNLFVADGKISEGDPEGVIADNSQLPQLADLSYSASASYVASRWPILGFTPSLQFDTQSTGERLQYPRIAGFDPALNGFQTYNALIGFMSDRWEVIFGVRNLTDERTQLGIANFQTNAITVGRPRSWLVKLDFRF